MKLLELQKLLNDFIERTPDYARDLNVVIKLNSPSIGGSATTSVRGITRGIDWDRGNFFIHAKDPVVVKTKHESAFDAARDLLMYLATKPSKRKSYETSTAQDILKRVGYTEEEFIKYSKFFHRTEE